MKKNFMLILLFCQLTAYAQRKAAINIGETVPDAELAGVINYSSQSLKLIDFRGKLLVLDFWATWCAPCIAAFPKLDSLQRKFEGRLEILPVSAEEKSRIESFFTKMRKIRPVSFSSVAEDRYLDKLFPHLFLPHYVWIDQNGVFLGATGADQLTGKNIQDILDGKRVSLVQKKDNDNYVVTDVIGDYSLFAPSVLVRSEDTVVLRNIPSANIKFHSLLTGFTDGLVSGGSFSADGTELHVNNMPIRNLYRTAFLGSKVQAFNANSIIIDIKDSILYNRITTYKRSSAAELRGWLMDNGYCYSIKVAADLKDQKAKIMLRELNDYFGNLLRIVGKMEKRSCKVLALKRTNDKMDFISKGRTPEVRSDKLSLTIHNGNVTDLIDNLAIPLQNLPVIVDETGIVEKIDVELECQLSDIKTLNQELKRYGLELKEVERMVEVGVISELPSD